MEDHQEPRWSRLRKIEAAFSLVLIILLLSDRFADWMPRWIPGWVPIAAVIVTLMLLLWQLSIGPNIVLHRLEAEALNTHLRRTVDGYQKRLPAGVLSQEITLEAFIGNNSLYIDPPYLDGDNTATVSLQSDLESLVRDSNRVLLLGGPGTGKTLALEIFYRTLADQFLRDPKTGLLPVLIRLNRLVDVNDENTPQQDLLLQINANLEDQLPESTLVNRLIAQDRMVFLLDGLDEMASHRTPRMSGAKIDPLITRLLNRPGVLTCRVAFHELFVDGSETDQRFAKRFSLAEIPFNPHGIAFVHRFTYLMRLPRTASSVISTIEADGQLTELVTRPLILFMVTDVLTSHFSAAATAVSTTPHLSVPRDWSLSGVYRTYVHKWINIETHKSTHPALDATDRLWLARQLAWRIFCGREQKAYGKFEQQDLLIPAVEVRGVIKEWSQHPGHPDLDAEELEKAFLDVCHRNFLLYAGPNLQYRFVHKSFFEYFVADHILNELSADDGGSRHDVLAEALPDEVIDFLRNMLDEGIAGGLAVDAVRRSMMGIAAGATPNESDERLIARQQAANLLPIIADEPTLDTLKQLHDQEPSAFVRRGIAVGIALHHNDNSLLDPFVSSIDSNPEAASIHLGYNRVYFGDQERPEPGWMDDGTPECSRIFRATIRQLRHDRYRAIWAMSLMTLRLLLDDETRATNDLVRERRSIDAIWDALRIDDPTLGPVFSSEQQKLRAVLDRRYPGVV